MSAALDSMGEAAPFRSLRDLDADSYYEMLVRSVSPLTGAAAAAARVAATLTHGDEALSALRSLAARFDDETVQPAALCSMLRLTLSEQRSIWTATHLYVSSLRAKHLVVDEASCSLALQAGHETHADCNLLGSKAHVYPRLCTKPTDFRDGRGPGSASVVRRVVAAGLQPMHARRRSRGAASSSTTEDEEQALTAAVLAEAERGARETEAGAAPGAMAVELSPATASQLTTVDEESVQSPLSSRGSSRGHVRMRDQRSPGTPRGREKRTDVSVSPSGSASMSSPP